MKTQKARINVRTTANSAGIRRERRNGRDLIIVPSATLPDDVVMNGILYPADEIAKGFWTLNRTPAPLGHPTINGAFVSASDPEGINRGWVGAFNDNVRHENGRVLLDKVIDVEMASQLVGGKAVLAAIDAGEAIHTSCALYGMMEKSVGVSNGKDYDYVMREMVFDHDAILLGEKGAATPDQGVGMLVNAAKADEVIVINSTLAEDAEQEIDWAVDYAAQAVEKIDRVSLIERVKAAIKQALMPERETSANEGAENMVAEKQLNDLSAKVDALADSIKGIGDSVGAAVANALKPVTDNIAELQANAKAKDDAEKATLVEQIVKANLLDDTAAKELTLNAARQLVAKLEPGTAAALNGAVASNAPAFKLPGD